MRKRRNVVWWAIGGFGTILSLMAIPLVAGAVSGSFSDVPMNHPFFTEVESIKKAGITQGSNECNPAQTPAYCPDSKVRRDAMAAFMERGFGRVEADEGGATVDDQSVEVIASTSIDAGAAGASTNGYVQVTITGNAFAEANCPCLVVVGIGDNGSIVAADATIATSTQVGDWAYQAVVPISGNSTHTYDLIATVSDESGPIESASVFGEITTLYFPFDGDANNTFIGSPGTAGLTLQSFAEQQEGLVLERMRSVLESLTS